MRILFVCLGNICRSPTAEAVMRDLTVKAGLADEITVDSAGTGDWHIGHPPDPRAQAVALRNGIDISRYRGRQVSLDDFQCFTHIIALDHDNLAALRALHPGDAPARLSLLLDHVPGRAGQAVADPYFGDASGFDVTWAEVSQAAAALVATLADRGR